MGLCWHIEKIDDYKTKCYAWSDKELRYTSDLNQVTEAIIHSCMAIEISAIKPENVEEFYTRYIMFNYAIGNNNAGLKLDDFKEHIGLYTNVGTRSWEYFDQKIATILRDRAERLIHNEKRGRL